MAHRWRFDERHRRFLQRASSSIVYKLFRDGAEEINGTMAGTDRGKRARGADGIAPGPAMILVEPQLGENIGMVARAMLNCGLGDLRLVVPDGWPNESAVNAASGADVILDRARVLEQRKEAIRDCSLVFAATARTRDMAKDQLTAKRAARELKALFNDGGRAGVLFGKESKGLNNNDVALADAIVQVPLNPGSISPLAQAVYLWVTSGSGQAMKRRMSFGRRGAKPRREQGRTCPPVWPS